MDRLSCGYGICRVIGASLASMARAVAAIASKPDRAGTTRRHAGARRASRYVQRHLPVFYSIPAFERLEPRVVLSASPSIGVNLDGISASSPEWVFNDAFLESSDWVSQAYDTVTGNEDWAGGPTLSVNANDWPTQLTTWTDPTTGDLMQQRAGTLMFRDINGNYPAGIYTVQWQGSGTLDFGFDAQLISQWTGSNGTNYAELQVTPTSAGIYLEIAATNPANPITNIHVWMPDASGNAQIGQVWAPGDNFSPFTPQFLAELQSFSTLRFMDWMDTNGTSVVNWSDARPLSYARQSDGTNGISYQYMIELANELNDNIWINIPYDASDNYITQLATLIETDLNPNLKVYVEWSNEAWNPQFPTYNWIESELSLPANAGLDFNQFEAGVISHDFSLFCQVFVGQTNRLERVVAGDVDDSLGLSELLKNLNGQYDVVADSAYVGLTSAQLAGFSASTTGDTVLNDGLLNLSTVIANLAANEVVVQSYATQLGRAIPFVAYEGGEDFSADGQTVSYQQALYDAQVNPRIYDLYEQLITEFGALGGSLFMHYSNISSNSKYGSYGALQYLGEPVSQAPKYEALLAAASGNWAATTSAPPTPTIVSALTISNNVVDLTWSTLLGAEAGFYIYGSTDGVHYTQMAVVPQNTLTYTLTGLQLSTTYTFYIQAFNGYAASVASATATATTGSAAGLTGIDLSSGFANAASLMTLNGTAALNSSTLELTDDQPYEAASAFTTNLVSVATFTTSFSFLLAYPAADGFTFCIQCMGPTALGGVGGALGYGADNFSGGNPAITGSVAIKFDMANNAGEGGDSTGMYLNGAEPTVLNSIDLTNTGINLHSSDVFNVTMTYDGATLAVTITDTVTLASATEKYTVSIGPSAYVGFTAGTGSMSAFQEILNWKFTSGAVPSAPSNLAATVNAGPQVMLSWNDNSANETGFQIQRATSLNGTYSQVGSVGANVTTWTDTNATLNNQYYYRVVAVNAYGTSSSNTLLVTASYASTISSLGPTINYAPGAAATVVASAASMTIGSNGPANSKLTVSISSAGSADTATVVAGNGVTVSGNTVSYNGTAIGTFTGGTGSTPLVVQFNSAATTAGIQAVVDDVAYYNTNPAMSIYDRTISFTLTDGKGVSSAMVGKTIHVAIVPPSITNLGSTATYYTGGSATIAAGSATVTAGSSGLASSKLTVTIGSAGSADIVTVVAGNGVTVSGSSVSYNGTVIGTFTAGAGSSPLVVQFNIAATTAGVQAVVDQVGFYNTNAAMSVYDRTVSFTLTDNRSVASTTATKTIHVVSLPPAIANLGSTVTYMAGSAATIVAPAATVTAGSNGLAGSTLTVTVASAGSTDVVTINAGNGVTISGTTLSYNGTAVATFTAGFGSSPLVVLFNASATTAAVQAVVNEVAFCNINPAMSIYDRTVSFTLTDSRGVASAAVSKAVHVVAPTPVLGNLASTVNYTHASGPTAVASSVTVSGGSNGLANSKLVVGLVGLSGSADLVTILAGNGITISGSSLLYNGVVIGNFSAGSGSTPLVVQFNASATNAAVQAVANDVAYYNTNPLMSIFDRTISFTLTDNTGKSSTLVSETIHVL